MTHIHHFVMQVGTGRNTRIAQICNALSAHNLVALFDPHLIQVGISGLVTELVVDYDLRAVTAT